MTYGQIAGNKSINRTIYRCFEYIPQNDAARFVKKFREQLQDQNQVMHTFRELILGAFLGSQGFKLRYEYTISNRTPDWSIVNQESNVICVIELINFHIDKQTEDKIKAMPINNTWVGVLAPNNDRLYDRLLQKIQTYKSVTEDNNLPYVIALFGEFTAAVNSDELKACLFDKKSGLFGLYPALSGILFFEENAGSYIFSYMRNTDATQVINLPGGIF
jgi:hypothetical protein